MNEKYYVNTTNLLFIFYFNHVVCSRPQIFKNCKQWQKNRNLFGVVNSRVLRKVIAILT